MEDIEMGERYGTSFSIKIDFSEFDDTAIVNQQYSKSKDYLPRTLDGVTKTR